MLDKVKSEINQRIPKKTQKYLIYVISILILVLVIALGFKPLLDSVSSLSTKVDSLVSELTELKKMDDNKASNKKAISQMNSDIDTILAKYPKTVFAEDMVMVFKQLEAENGINITDISIEPTNLVTSDIDKTTVSANSSSTNSSSSSSSSTSSSNSSTSSSSSSSSSNSSASSSTSSTESNAASKDYKLFVTPVNCTFDVSYAGVKLLFSSMFASPLKKNIENVTLSYDSEGGKLIGTMIVNFYTLEGSDANNDVHEAIPEVSKGTANIFHSIN